MRPKDWFVPLSQFRSEIEALELPEQMLDVMVAVDLLVMTRRVKKAAALSAARRELFGDTADGAALFILRADEKAGERVDDELLEWGARLLEISANSDSSSVPKHTLAAFSLLTLKMVKIPSLSLVKLLSENSSFKKLSLAAERLIGWPEHDLSCLCSVLVAKSAPVCFAAKHFSDGVCAAEAASAHNAIAVFARAVSEAARVSNESVREMIRGQINKAPRSLAVEEIRRTFEQSPTGRRS